MSKIIIENRTELDDDHILMLVSYIVRKGRVSNYGKEYCLCTTVKNECAIFTSKNKKSDKFTIVDY